MCALDERSEKQSEQKDKVRMKKVISVFGSSRPRELDPEYVEALNIGRALAKAGFIVCNGGYGGIMEASARGAKEAGARVLRAA